MHSSVENILSPSSQTVLHMGQNGNAIEVTEFRLSNSKARKGIEIHHLIIRFAYKENSVVWHTFPRCWKLPKKFQHKMCLQCSPPVLSDRHLLLWLVLEECNELEVFLPLTVIVLCNTVFKDMKTEVLLFREIIYI